MSAKFTDLDYYNKHLIDGIIKKLARKGKIIYGAKAINAQLPYYLRKPTYDFDIFSNTPKKDAEKLESELDYRYGRDSFTVKQAKHRGTWKVKSKITNKTIADFTKKTTKIPSKRINSNEYARLKWIKQKIKENLKKPENKYRFPKDREALRRINLYEQHSDFLLG